MKTTLMLGLAALLITTSVALIPTGAAESDLEPQDCFWVNEDERFIRARAYACTDGSACYVYVSGAWVQCWR